MIRIRITTYFFVLILFFCALSITSAPAAQEETNIDPSTLSLEEFFKIKPFGGKSARMIAFSENDRYLSFLWNKYDQQGDDFYIYDLAKKSLKPVTSMERMKQYDPPEDYERFLKKLEQKKKEDKKEQQLYFMQRDYLMGKDVDLEKFEKEEIQQLKKELEAEEKKKKEKEKKELELWELRDKLKEKKEKEKIKPGDLYPGVTRYKWSKKAAELIFEYRGDLFRYFPAGDKLQRLTMTDEKESPVDYTADGKGYYYSIGNKLFRVMLGSSLIFQINPRLKDKLKKDDDDKDAFKICSTSISPNGKWMLMVATKQKGKPSPKEIHIMDYKKRFAQPVKVERQTLDDKVTRPTYRLYLRKIRTNNYGKEPGYIYEIASGDDWFDLGRIYWSEDGSRYAFMTWEREKGDLKLWVGKAAPGKKPGLLYETKEEIGYEFYFYRDIKFTPDSKNLVVVLNNKKGFKQPYIFDLETKKKRMIVDGPFESYPIIGFSKDGQYIYLEADKPEPAVHNVYKVSIKTGKMTPIGKPGGMHRRSVISHNGNWLAANFGNWDKRPELFLVNTASKEERILTDSHGKEWEKYDFIKPGIFKFKNRHGVTIYGMVFKPLGWKPGDKRPGILHVYGGPLGVAHDVEIDSYDRLSYLFQMIMAAKHGYVTITIDPRGMSGYGRKFSEANFEQVGKPQVEDLEDLVKHLETGFGVDTRRIGIHGSSFGGFQTLMTILSSPDTFACGIAVASVTEWENNNQWYTGAFITKRVAGKPTARKYSLLPLAKNLKKPLLLIHDMQDKNVLFQDTLHIYRAFLETGKETLVELFLAPEGGHGFGGIVPNKPVFKKFESWFLRHLGNPSAKEFH